ncbi:MAG: DUF99 family protein [Ignisphaera sp.]
MLHCYLGVDDGYFDVSFKRSNLRYRTILVGAVVCGSKFQDLLIDFATIDGLDATAATYRIIEKTYYLYIVQAVLLDGVTYAGFNLVDPRKLYNLTNIPIVVVFRHKLDLNKIKFALERHFPDHRYRYEVIEAIYSRSVELPLEHIPTILRIYSIGIGAGKAKEIVLKLCKVFADPHPLRIADRVASTLGKIMLKKYQDKLILNQ